MTIYKIGNITVHIHGNVNQKNLEEATANFESCKRKQKDEKRELYSLIGSVIVLIVATAAAAFVFWWLTMYSVLCERDVAERLLLYGVRW